VSTEKDRYAMPFLYGAPAHGRRRVVAVDTERPSGPDDLPIENYRSPEDHALATELFPRSYTSRPRMAPAVAEREADAGVSAQLKGRPLVLRALAGRLMQPRGTH
jgi:hypothetical protein